MKSQGVDYILSNAINFIDFMQLLEMVSVKVGTARFIGIFLPYLQLGIKCAHCISLNRNP